jgi:hypothetical protein
MTEEEKRRLDTLERLFRRLQKMSKLPTSATLAGVIEKYNNLVGLITESR